MLKLMCSETVQICKANKPETLLGIIKQVMFWVYFPVEGQY
jgi:hypothetical protein